ncbi:O-antigen ligase family protein [Terrabacter aerolatus]|uniref:O-antigen ligase family protein n=1 Tax=Terrabacter aerolatus TaxID=422442 RepID=UPI0011BF7C01|nr:O-antigen ligase family protein [Terrabacter aerolatus]
MTLATVLVTSWFLSGDIIHLEDKVPMAFLAGTVLASAFVLLAPAASDSRRTANGNANDVAMAIVMGLGCALYLLLKGRRRNKIVAVASLPLLLTAGIATGSRTAVFGAAGIVLVVTFVAIGQRRWGQLAGVISAILVLILVVDSLPKALIPERLSSIGEALQSGNLSNRTIIWDAILERGWDMVGVGAGASPSYLGGQLGFSTVAHNVFLGVLLETGALGLMVFGWLLARLALDARNSRFSSLILFLAPAVAAGSLALTLEARRMLWLVIALSWSQIYADRREARL